MMKEPRRLGPGALINAALTGEESLGSRREIVRSWIRFN